MPFCITKYERYAIHEPAEGGYFYEGLHLNESSETIYDTKRAAIAALRSFIKEENVELDQTDEEYLHISADGTSAFTTNHRYIGDGIEYHIESVDQRGCNQRGRVPYC